MDIALLRDKLNSLTLPHRHRGEAYPLTLAEMVTVLHRLENYDYDIKRITNDVEEIFKDIAKLIQAHPWLVERKALQNRWDHQVNTDTDGKNNLAHIKEAQKNLATIASYEALRGQLLTAQASVTRIQGYFDAAASEWETLDKMRQIPEGVR